jgi:hypothetical protein
MQYKVYTVLGVQGTQYTCRSVYVALSACLTLCMWYAVYMVLSSCGTCCVWKLPNVLLHECCTSLHNRHEVNLWWLLRDMKCEDITFCCAMMVQLYMHRSDSRIMMEPLGRIQWTWAIWGTACVFHFSISCWILSDLGSYLLNQEWRIDMYLKSN